MFSQVEENYIKGLIGSYFKQGYEYYVCHTVTETDNDYDLCIYFSKEEIKAIDSLNFELTNAVCLQIDSSSRNDNSYNPSTHSRVDLDNNYSGTLTINQAEFIYTNAVFDYETTAVIVHPDINYNGYSVKDNWLNLTICFILVILFVYTFVRDIFRIRR